MLMFYALLAVIIVGTACSFGYAVYKGETSQWLSELVEGMASIFEGVNDGGSDD